MQTHAHMVEEILAEVEFLEPMVEIASGHHSHYDGNGYGGSGSSQGPAPQFGELDPGGGGRLRCDDLDPQLPHGTDPDLCPRRSFAGMAEVSSIPMSSTRCSGVSPELVRPTAREISTTMNWRGGWPNKER